MSVFKTEKDECFKQFPHSPTHRYEREKNRTKSFPQHRYQLYSVILFLFSEYAYFIKYASVENSFR